MRKTKEKKRDWRGGVLENLILGRDLAPLGGMGRESLEGGRCLVRFIDPDGARPCVVSRQKRALIEIESRNKQSRWSVSIHTKKPGGNENYHDPVTVAVNRNVVAL